MPPLLVLLGSATFGRIVLVLPLMLLGSCCCCKPACSTAALHGCSFSKSLVNFKKSNSGIEIVPMCLSKILLEPVIFNLTVRGRPSRPLIASTSRAGINFASFFSVVSRSSTYIFGSKFTSNFFGQCLFKESDAK